MKAISPLFVTFCEKISALFARRLQSIKGTSFLHLPHSKLRVKPLDFGRGGGGGGGGGGSGGGSAFRTRTATSLLPSLSSCRNPAPLAQGGFARSGRLTLDHGGNN